MSSDSKKPIKDLYKEIYEYLYGKKSQTLGEFGPLYKESINYLLPKTSQNTQGGKLQVVAEKIARLSKRTLQFEGQGFYSGIGEFGEDLISCTTLKCSGISCIEKAKCTQCF